MLPKRLEKFNLYEVPEKMQLMRFSRFHPGVQHRFGFLGFEFYWDTDKTGIPRLFRRTLRKKLKAVKLDLKKLYQGTLTHEDAATLYKLTAKLRGHYNYFGVVGNLKDLWRVYSHVVELLYKWLNRRSGRKSLAWDGLKRLLDFRPLPLPVFQEKETQRRVSGNRYSYRVCLMRS